MLRHQHKNRLVFSRHLAITLLLGVFSAVFFALNLAAEISSDTADIPDPVSGVGRVAITIETARGGNPKRISQTAQRVEIWLGDSRLASLEKGDAMVEDTDRGRVFMFPEILLPHGYYFLTARCYGPAAIFGRRKWHGETFQIGIHPDKVSRVIKKINFFHW